MTEKDLKGIRFGKLVAIKYIIGSKAKKRKWICKCDCGKRTEAETAVLISGRKKNCGCGNRYNDLLGKRIGNVVVLKYEGTDKSGYARWLCECVCGKRFVTVSRYLINGKKSDCGCLFHEKMSKAIRKESGLSTRNKIIDNYKRNAKRKNTPFKLSAKKMMELFQGNCFYCGCAPATTTTKKGGYGSFTYNGIDQKIPSKGYIPGNVVTCCKICNFMKGLFTIQQFIEKARLIAQKHPKKSS
jgi:hypothetical protein